MITKLASIQQVKVQVLDDVMIKGVLEPLEFFNDRLFILPASFKMNGGWNVSHSCYNCLQKITFGCKWDGRINNCSYFSAQPLSSKYYVPIFLQELSRVLEDTHVVISSETNWHALTPKTFTEINQPFLFYPILNILSYKCGNCHAEYLGRYRFSPGSWPEQGCPEGSLNLISIDEIIAIELSDYSNFREMAAGNIILSGGNVSK